MRNIKFKVLALMVLVCSSIWGQEGQIDNSPIFYKEGKVGIGTNNPHAKLEIGISHNYNQDEELRIGSYYQSKFIGLGLNYRIDHVGSCSKYLVTYHGGVRNDLLTFSHNNKVGIGISPQEKLHVSGNLRLELPVKYSPSKSFIIFGDGNDHVIQGQAWTGGANNNVKTRIRFTQRGLAFQVPKSFNKFDEETDFSTGIFLTSGYGGNPRGYLGIGTTKPAGKLHVEDGNIYIKDPSNSKVRSIFFSPSDNSKRNYIQAFQTEACAPDYLQIGSHHGSVRFTSESSDNPTENMRILRNGNVGIGTTTPDYKLDVCGTMRAKEVVVEEFTCSNGTFDGTLAANNITVKTNGNTADFVFEEDYHLKDLTEVEDYIKNHGHLPDIPSAAKMEEQGVNLAEMNKLLLQKIEELMLYSIQKDKEVKSFEERLTKIEALLNNDN